MKLSLIALVAAHVCGGRFRPRPSMSIAAYGDAIAWTASTGNTRPIRSSGTTKGLAETKKTASTLAPAASG